MQLPHNDIASLLYYFPMCTLIYIHTKYIVSAKVIDGELPRRSLNLTYNVGYGCGNEQDHEEIYDQIGSRRNGVYGGDIGEMDSNAIYDVVL